jgi:prevent-host-death family protein
VKTWAVQDAKAHFSEFLQASLVEGPQLVTRHGKEAAVLVPVDQWRLLNDQVRPGLKALLLADQPKAELHIPERGGKRRRTLPPST